ncbi:hypothetical protein [Streptomyces sp. PSKA30]|uniref:hypothetical protein n=1 Tax=Streptomyces sp. PSKA30 TaxID=2874597 RepID=UPI001CD11D92|nr:hypothetical protein [Streptomyces sp. PSKA30]MBZ9642147.1 hypothetical protein [Streptomyces sp. PSKA30]
MAVSPHHESLHQVFQQDTKLLVTSMQGLLGLSIGPETRPGQASLVAVPPGVPR